MNLILLFGVPEAELCFACTESRQNSIIDKENVNINYFKLPEDVLNTSRENYSAEGNNSSD